MKTTRSRKTQRDKHKREAEEPKERQKAFLLKSEEQHTQESEDIKMIMQQQKELPEHTTAELGIL